LPAGGCGSRGRVPAGSRGRSSWAIQVLAATGLVLWIIYVSTDTDALRWVAFAVLLVVAALGFTMARLWRQERAAAEAATGQSRAELPPEQHFPCP
jgi:hypothetical protein